MQKIQISLDNKSSLLTTFSTPFGWYRFLKIPFGINSASEVFQCSMKQIFTGYPCAVIVDDILVGGHTEKGHDDNLERVLEWARQVNLRLNPLKCKFRLKEVSYVGHIFSSDGLMLIHQRLRPSVKCQSPQMPLLFRDFSAWSTIWESSSLTSVIYLLRSAS